MSLVGDFPKTPMEIADPTKASVFFEDFMNPYNSSDWTVTETDGGATQASNNANHGELLITNTAADDDAVTMQVAAENHLFVSGKESWFKIRVKSSDVTQNDFIFGLVITDTSPFSNADGVYFSKTDGVATLDCYVNKDSSSDTSAAIATLADDTYVELAFLYDGQSSVIFYVNGVRKATLATTNLPDDEELTPTIYMRAGEAAAKTMTIDYVLAGQER